MLVKGATGDIRDVQSLSRHPWWYTRKTIVHWRMPLNPFRTRMIMVGWLSFHFIDAEKSYNRRLYWFSQLSRYTMTSCYTHTFSYGENPPVTSDFPQSASNVVFWWSLCWYIWNSFEQTTVRPVIWDSMVRMWRHCSMKHENAYRDYFKMNEEQWWWKIH